MMKISCHLLVPLILFANCATAGAQSRVPAEAVIGRMTLTRDVGSLLSTVKPLARDAALRSAAQGGITASSDPIKQELSLTGEAGYLIQVVVETEPATGVSAIAGGAPLLLGSGSTPAHVLARQKDRLLPGPRSGFQISKENSFYVWIRNNKQNEQEYGLITYPMSNGLELEALQLRSDAMLIDALEADRSTRVVAHMIDKLKSDASTRARAGEAAKVWDAIYNDTKYTRQVETQLKQEMARSASADAMIARINTVKTFASMPTLAKEAATLFNDPVFVGIDDSRHLLTKINERKKEADGLIVTYRGQLEIRKADRSTKIKDLRSTLRGIGVPESVLTDAGL